MRVLIKVLDPCRVESRRAADQSVYLITLLEEELCRVDPSWPVIPVTNAGLIGSSPDTDPRPFERLSGSTPRTAGPRPAHRNVSLRSCDRSCRVRRHDLRFDQFERRIVEGARIAWRSENAGAASRKGLAWWLLHCSPLPGLAVRPRSRTSAWTAHSSRDSDALVDEKDIGRTEDRRVLVSAAEGRNWMLRTPARAAAAPAADCRRPEGRR